MGDWVTASGCFCSRGRFRIVAWSRCALDSVAGRSRASPSAGRLGWAVKLPSHRTPPTRTLAAAASFLEGACSAPRAAARAPGRDGLTPRSVSRFANYARCASHRRLDRRRCAARLAPGAGLPAIARSHRAGAARTGKPRRGDGGRESTRRESHAGARSAAATAAGGIRRRRTGRTTGPIDRRASQPEDFPSVLAYTHPPCPTGFCFLSRRGAVCSELRFGLFRQRDTASAGR